MIGVKTMFVRTGGCDYKCVMCDSMHAVDPKAIKQFAKRMPEEEIFRELLKAKHETGVEWVTLSGGNPCMWDLSYLIALCQAAGIKVALETQGTQWKDWIRQCDQVTLSPKAPGMGEKFEPEVFRAFINKLHGYKPKTCLKVVAFSQLDMDFALHIGEIAAWVVNPENFYLSIGNPYPPILSTDPQTGEISFGDNPEFADINQVSELLRRYKTLLEDFLQDRRFSTWKILPQLHVLLWGNEAGV